MCDAGTETAETETETAETADEVHYNTPLPFFQNGRGIIRVDGYVFYPFMVSYPAVFVAT